MERITCIDVAVHCLRGKQLTSAMKLQKIVYYCQAWSLVVLEKPLFQESIEAWTYGPVVPMLYAWHKGKFLVGIDDIRGAGPKDIVDVTKKKLVTVVSDRYGKYSGKELSDMTHREAPWLNARLEPEGYPSNEIISFSSMKEFYSKSEAREEIERQVNEK